MTKQQQSLWGAYRVHVYTSLQLTASQLTLGCRALLTPVISEERGHGSLVIFTPHLFWHPSTGCILGVGLVLSLMSHSGQMESRVHVAASLRKLSAYLDDSGSQSRTFQEVGDQGSTSLPLCWLLSSSCCLFSTSPVLVTLKLNPSLISTGLRRKSEWQTTYIFDHKDFK